MGSICDEAERNAAWEAMQQDSLTMGPQVKAFQDELAASHGVRHALAVSNCTTGMHLCTQLFDLRQGDEVIMTPITFFATTLALLKEKVAPVYADIGLRTGNIDPADVARQVTSKTRAILPMITANPWFGGQAVAEVRLNGTEDVFWYRWSLWRRIPMAPAVRAAIENLTPNIILGRSRPAS